MKQHSEQILLSHTVYISCSFVVPLVSLMPSLFSLLFSVLFASYTTTKWIIMCKYIAAWLDKHLFLIFGTSICAIYRGNHRILRVRGSAWTSSYFIELEFHWVPKFRVQACACKHFYIFLSFLALWPSSSGGICTKLWQKGSKSYEK